MSQNIYFYCNNTYAYYEIKYSVGELESLIFF